MGLTWVSRRDIEVVPDPALGFRREGRMCDDNYGGPAVRFVFAVQALCGLAVGLLLCYGMWVSYDEDVHGSRVVRDRSGPSLSESSEYDLYMRFAGEVECQRRLALTSPDHDDAADHLAAAEERRLGRDEMHDLLVEIYPVTLNDGHAMLEWLNSRPILESAFMMHADECECEAHYHCWDDQQRWRTDFRGLEPVEPPEPKPSVPRHTRSYGDDDDSGEL